MWDTTAVLGSTRLRGWTARKTRFESRQGQEIYFIRHIYQPPIEKVPNALSLGSKAAGSVKLTTHFHLMPKLRMRGSTPPSLMTWTRTALALHCNYFDLSTYARHLRDPPLCDCSRLECQHNISKYTMITSLRTHSP
jgi:hypothetical protein